MTKRVYRGDSRRRSRGLIGLLLLNAMVPAPAFAQDLPPPEEVLAPVPPTQAQHIAIDGSAVGTSLHGQSLEINGTFAPLTDINETGFRVRLSESASWYRFVTGDNPRTFGSGHTFETGVLAGYQLSYSRVSFLGLVGPTLAESKDAGIAGSHWGVRVVASMYALPTDWSMAFSSVSYSTISNFLQVQSKIGVKFAGDWYVGPEAIFSWRDVVPGLENVAQMRLGAHISALKLGPMSLGFSGGWAHEQNLGSGYYAGMNFYVTY